MKISSFLCARSLSLIHKTIRMNADLAISTVAVPSEMYWEEKLIRMISQYLTLSRDIDLGSATYPQGHHEEDL